MKSTLTLLAFVLAFGPVLAAQEGVVPERLQIERPPKRPPAPPEVKPMPAAEPEVTLIPEQVPEKPKTAPTPTPKPEAKSKTEESAEELQKRIHFREARIKALRDPQVQAEYARAMKAKTDLLKREALTDYYKLLYARILKIDPSVKTVSDLRLAASLRRLVQTRIDPTEPIDPEERAEALARGE